VETLVAWLPILGIILIFWLLLIRPAQRRQKQLNSLQDSIAVGDPVLTSAGIFGTIARIDDDDKLGVEVADGVVITVARGAIVGLLKEPETDAVGAPETDVEQGQE